MSLFRVGHLAGVCGGAALNAADPRNRQCNFWKQFGCISCSADWTNVVLDTEVQQMIKRIDIKQLSRLAGISRSTIREVLEENLHKPHVRRGNRGLTIDVALVPFLVRELCQRGHMPNQSFTDLCDHVLNLRALTIRQRRAMQRLCTGLKKAKARETRLATNLGSWQEERMLEAARQAHEATEIGERAERMHTQSMLTFKELASASRSASEADSANGFRYNKFGFNFSLPKRSMIVILPLVTFAVGFGASMSLNASTVQVINAARDMLTSTAESQQRAIAADRTALDTERDEFEARRADLEERADLVSGLQVELAGLKDERWRLRDALAESEKRGADSLAQLSLERITQARLASELDQKSKLIAELNAEMEDLQSRNAALEENLVEFAARESRVDDDEAVPVASTDSNAVAVP